MRFIFHWFQPNAQGRGSKDCAQADEWSEHPVLQQETRLLPQIPSGEMFFFSKKCSWRKFFSQSMWLESPITFLHCVHEARMKKIVHLPPPSEKQIYIVQVADSGLYIETWLIWHYFQDWLSICQKSKLSNKKTFSSSPLSDKNGNPRYCGDNVLLGELWSQQNKPRGNGTQKFSSFFLNGIFE